MSRRPTTATPNRTYDIDALVRATDLADLADDLLGTRKGSAVAPTWPCPNPDHPQTGRTPPVTLFVGRDGKQRWHCHGCGNQGDAINLLRQVKNLTFRDAVHELAAKLGVTPTFSTKRAGQPGGHDPTPQASGLRPNPALREYTARCARALWTPNAKSVREWLTQARQLPEDILRVNRIGADLGGDHPRPDGLRRVRAAAVLPVLVDGEAAYLQLRVLAGAPNGPKYLNPPNETAQNPRLGFVEPTRPDGWRRELIITEGILDGLSAAAGGYRAAAVLGASFADPAAAQLLASRPERLIVAFDPDPAGRASSERLVRLLQGFGRNPGVMVLREGDLNHCHRRATDWWTELDFRVSRAIAEAGRIPSHHVGPTLT